MKTWYTQPKEGFSSFYYYDESSLELVRIRLELNRAEKETDPGNTGAFYRSHRAVGFTIFLYSDKECRKFRPKGAKVIDSMGATMSGKPRLGRRIYDLSSDGKTGRNMGVHQGNTVIDEHDARLPGDINEGHLRRLARICLMKKEDIVLTKGDATEEELAVAIKKAIETRHGSMEEDRYEELSFGGDTTTSHRGRRRRHRCTII